MSTEGNDELGIFKFILWAEAVPLLARRRHCSRPEVGSRLRASAQLERAYAFFFLANELVLSSVAALSNNDTH